MSTPDQAEKGQSEPVRCQLCQRTSVLAWHCLQTDVLDRAECRVTAGDGIWVCEICEEAMHRWMAQHPGPGSARAAEQEMIARLSRFIAGQPRPYRRREH